MRWLVVVALNIAVVRGALAATQACYAGIDESGDARIATVFVRDVDRDAREIRTRTWRANAPHREFATTFHIAADDHAFGYDSRGIHGTGALDGAPWAWTSYDYVGQAFGGKLISSARIVKDRFLGGTRFEQNDLVRWHVTTVATAFDCRDLDRKRAALDDSASDAVRTCFAGSQTLLGDTSSVVVEQIVESKRIVLVISSPKLDNRVVLAIDGKAITASNGHAWIGTGTLDGKLGAWTSYSYRARVDDSDLVVTGTLGGKRIKRTDVSSGPVTGTASLDASAFDCAHLEERLATLTATP